MIFTQAPLPGVYIIEIEAYEDGRGFFARTVCQEEFKRHGINADFVQQSVSWNRHQGTVRGLHYQASPYEEEKLVRVTRGAIFDVVVDIRSDSPTCGQWFSVELSSINHRQIYIPKGCAHGFQTLHADTEVLYQMTVPYHPKAQRGILWNDPTFRIAWPFPVVDSGDNTTLSKADSLLPEWKRDLVGGYYD